MRLSIFYGAKQCKNLAARLCVMLCQCSIHACTNIPLHPTTCKFKHFPMCGANGTSKEKKAPIVKGCPSNILRYSTAVIELYSRININTFLAYSIVANIYIELYGSLQKTYKYKYISCIFNCCKYIELYGSLPKTSLNTLRNNLILWLFFFSLMWLVHEKNPKKALNK